MYYPCRKLPIPEMVCLILNKKYFSANKLPVELTLPYKGKGSTVSAFYWINTVYKRIK